MSTKFRLRFSSWLHVELHIPLMHFTRTIFIGRSVWGKRIRQKPAGPSIRALFAIDCLVSPEHAEEITANLAQAYERVWVAKYGHRGARVIFWMQSAGAIVSFWTNWLMKRL